MRRIHLLAVAVAVLLSMASFASAANAQRERDDEAVRLLIGRFVDDWNRHDMNSWAQCLSEDADYVVIGGKHLKGRDEIEKYHEELHKGFYKGSQLSGKAETIRYVGPLGITHIAWELTYDEGKQKRTGFATVVLAKQRGKWLITAFHNSLTEGPPATPAK